MRVLIAAVLATALGAVAPVAAAEKALRGSSKLEAIQKAQEAHFNGLFVNATQSRDRSTRRSATAQMKGAYGSDPKLTKRLLETLEKTLAGQQSLPDEGRYNALWLLVETTDRAWTADLVARAARIEARYRSAGHLTVGSREKALVQKLSVRTASMGDIDTGYGQIQAQVVEKARFIDVDIFVCQSGGKDAGVIRLARSFAGKVADRDFGRVSVKPASDDLMRRNGARAGFTTIVYDKGLSEEAKLEELKALLEGSNLPGYAAVANRGDPSYWYLSAFICP